MTEPFPPAVSDAQYTIPQIVQPVQRLSSTVSVKPLGQRLVEAGLLREDQLETALAHQASEEQRLQAIAAREGTDSVGRMKRKHFKRLGEVVAELGMVDEASLLPMLGEQLGVEGVKLREGLIDPLALRLIPREYAQRYQALPLIRVRDELTVAMADPQDLAAIDALREVSGCEIRPVLTLASGIERLLPRCYEDEFALVPEAAALDVDTLDDVSPDAIDLDASSNSSQVDGSPITNLVNYVVIQAVRQGASDIHIEAGQTHTSVRFRIDGVLREVMRPRNEAHAAIISHIKTLARLDLSEHQRPQNGLLRVRISRRDVDLRVSSLPTVRGEKIVMRVLDEQRLGFDLERLGLTTEHRERFCRMLDRPGGLIVVNGPSGSGKSTTLYAAIERIKGIDRNVVTIEDPVEYQLDRVNQVPVHSDLGVSFSDAIDGALRQDPDVIMISAVKDASTAVAAVDAALAGHLVLAALPTRDGADAVTRLTDMGVDGYKLASCLLGVLSQQLVRQLCSQCRESYYPSRSQLRELGYAGDLRRSFSRGRGCSQCYESGFRGRTGVFEWFEATADIRHLLRTGCHAQAFRQAHAVGPFGQNLISEGIRLAETEVTSLDEIQRILPIDWQVSDLQFAAGAPSDAPQSPGESL